MRFKNPTAEEIEIDEAMEAHMDALSFEHFVFKVSVGIYFVGFPFFIFGEGWFKRMGVAMVMVALLAMLFHVILHIGTERKRRAVQVLLEPYLKHKSLPLFHDLQEKFADDPNTRLVHSDDGNITIMRKKGGDDEDN